MNKKIIICTGGTGGHVIPAIIFGNYLLDKGFECSIILDKRGSSFSQEFKGKIHLINSSHLSGGIYYKIRSLANLFLGFIQSLILIIKIRPSKCVSFGSYAAFTPLLSVLILRSFFRIDIFIHEQNSIIGKVNLFFLKYANYIFLNFKFTKNLEKKFLVKQCHVGLPSNNNFELKKIKLNIDYNKTVLFIYGGSQGSVSLIKKSLLILQSLDKKNLKKIKIFIQSPKIIFNDVETSLNHLNIDYEIKDFYNNINEILSITNIAITRAGAGTINDLIRFKIPSIIIPLHYSIYNHQYYNAKYLSDKNAAILMDEINFNIDINSQILKKLLNDLNQQEFMKNELSKLILPEASQLMINNIYK